MLPMLLYNNMEGGSNSLNNASFNGVYDESVIINSVRIRKKVSELPNCPVCSCTIRHGELDSHLSLEVYKLQKLTNGGSKRKLSSNSSMAVAGSSTDSLNNEEVDVTGCLGSDVYQRVHTNRLRRLRARRRLTPPPTQGECPICNSTLPMSKLQKHALRCLKRTGASVDEDVSDTSSEDGSIDVENDGPSASGFGAEYQWCGDWRVRATALQDAQARLATCVRRSSNDQNLVVDGDEDTELYGPPQYSPSRIAPDAEISPTENGQTEEQNGTSDVTENGQESAENSVSASKANSLVQASAEVRVQALKARIIDLEKKQNSAAEARCLICLGSFTSATVSIQCWHVYCEICWLQSLKAKKICPQCNAITTTQHLRRIYM